MTKRRRSFSGLVPRLGQGIVAIGRWTVRHPQPLILCAALLASLWGFWGYAQRADAFRITHVHLPPGSSLHLPTPLIGVNLWDLDLRALAGELKAQQPWLKDVRVVRQLPNALHIDAIPRLPIAQVKLDRWHLVDGEGFIVPQGSAAPAESVVRLVGLERATLRVGTATADERLTPALRIVERLRRAPALLSYRLTEANVADPQQIRFRIDLPARSGATPTEGDIEVRCGREAELDAQLERLRVALRAVAKRALDIHYIDVRFPEPVVGPR